MRKSPVSSTVTPFPVPSSRSHDRRPLASFFGHLTCLVLVKHHATDKALFVSDDGDAVGAVWAPRAMLSIDPADRGKYLVATLSQAFAAQKRLEVRFIDHDRLTPEESAQLGQAQELAKRTRQRLNGSRAPMAWSGGRNAFA
jgi:hypothetical protein